MYVPLKTTLRKVRSAAWNNLYRFTGSKLRFFSQREDFLKLLPQQSVGVELGVFKGQFSEHILKIVNPRELHLVDVWWTVFGEYYPDWGVYTEHGNLTTKEAYDSAMRIVEMYGAGKKVIVHVGSDLEYLDSLPDDHLDWAYIDSSHEYEHTQQELNLLRRKIKNGGMITGDDWKEEPDHIHHGVCRAVREFCASQRWEIILLDNHSQWAIQQAK